MVPALPLTPNSVMAAAFLLRAGQPIVRSKLNDLIEILEYMECFKQFAISIDIYENDDNLERT